MYYAEAVSKAIAYIENRLHERLAAEDIAAQAGYSPYHFSRIFQLVTRCTVSEYVRGRRLTHAAYDLFCTKLRIVDIAVKYQFSSQEAFTRAFQARFSISPGRFRMQKDMKDTLFRAMEMRPLDEAGLRHLIDGVTTEPAIVASEPIGLIGIETRGLRRDKIGELWNDLRRRETEIGRRRRPGSAYYAVVELVGPAYEVSYTACVEVGDGGEPPEGMVRKTLPAATYAVFTHKGVVSRMQETFQYIYGSWMPRSGTHRADGPEFARYDGRYLGPMNENSEIDIYIPVSPSVRRKPEAM